MTEACYLNGLELVAGIVVPVTNPTRPHHHPLTISAWYHPPRPPPLSLLSPLSCCPRWHVVIHPAHSATATGGGDSQISTAQIGDRQ